MLKNRVTDQEAARWLQEDLLNGCPVGFAFERLMSDRFGDDWFDRLAPAVQLEQRIMFLFGYLAGLPVASRTNRAPVVLQLKRLLEHREQDVLDQIALLEIPGGQYADRHQYAGAAGR
ncbi:MAG: hypothetical protein B7Z37_28895 [Verrucomicrobia bacterium 12-59-8]|nr:MAG: hypothetical protein B7Z37_28895 [Verrucomicrobia bacterium 12-59-8]